MSLGIVEWLSIPDQLRAESEFGWLEPGPLTIDDYIAANPEISRSDLSARKRAHIFINGETSDFWCAHLPKMTSLKSLCIRGMITQRVLNSLALLPQIVQLKIYNVLAKDLSPFADLKQLTHLSISYTKSFADLAAFIDAQGLIALSVGLPKGPYPLEHFSEMRAPNLKSLLLASCADTGYARFQSIEPLNALSSLHYLCLANVKADDNRLSVLKAGNLKGVSLSAPEWWDLSGIVHSK